MSSTKKRSEEYGEIADRLIETCMHAIDENGRSAIDSTHGAPSIGHIAYILGELHRCRPATDLTSVHGCNLVSVMRHMIDSQLDLDNEIHRCFLAMGLGLMGTAGGHHMVLKGVSERQCKLIDEGLVADKEFDNNWEAFNGSTIIGRHMLYGEPADAMLPHFEKIARKYDETGYFDDTLRLGNYNNYGFMSVNYPLRAGEFLASDHPARRVIETRFRQHALRYANLVRKLVAPCGDTWPFGRSAGVLGQLQCVVLIEQCLSKKWIEPKDVNQFRAIARLATKRMHDLYWDESRQWFNFRDEFQTAYDYRASHPMAWDMLRYFLQIERYAAADERYGVPDEESVAHGGPRHEEIVTNPALKTAIYVWSDGRDHAVLPIMAGPHHITGDALARPYAQGLFEWSTQHTVAALCPRLLIDGESYWPAWHAKHTKLETDGAESIYQVHFGRIVSDEGKACASEVDCETSYVFSSGVFRRIDIWTVTQQLVIDDFALEVLQPAKHPRRPQFGEVHELDVTWISEIEAIRLTGRLDVSALPVYRNYHGHASHSWKIRGSQIRLERGQYRTELRLRW